MARITKKAFEAHLNDVGEGARIDGYICVSGKYSRSKLGTAMRRIDPYQFDVLYADYVRNNWHRL